MQHSLTSLFAALPVQPAADRPLARVAARDGAPSARADADRAGEQAFQLPPEPQERGRGIDRPRSHRDEPRASSERRRADDAREPAARRDDPPSRSDPPRGADRARDGEPPRREDARAEVGERAPPDRAEAPASARATDETQGDAGAQPDCHAAEAETGDGGTGEDEVASAMVTLPVGAACGPALGELGGSVPTDASDEAIADEEAAGTDGAGAAEAMGAADPAGQLATGGAPAAQTVLAIFASPPASLATDAAHDAPAAAAPVDDTGAKPTFAHSPSMPGHERGERDGEAIAAETGKSAGAGPMPGDGGAAARAAVKIDGPAANAFEPAPAAAQASPAPSSGAPSALTAPAPAVPIRVMDEVPLGAVPVEIGLKSLAGINHFEIRLDPAELGRIEVRLDIDEDGGVKAQLTVDRVETLALLQRDARSLERAFEQAGLKPTDGSVDLSLRDGRDGQGRHDNGGEPRRENPSRTPEGPRDKAETVPPEARPARGWRGAAGVDVRI
jgi:flagellar hook-length control protein FliK